MRGWTESDIEDLRGDAEVRDSDTTKRPPALEGSGDGAVGVDPGTTTGVAVANNATIVTFTMDFWEVHAKAAHGLWSDLTFVVEAPHKTKWGKAQDNSAMAYNSGGVAREAELLVQGLRREGIEVIEHDPHNDGGSWGSGKWDSETAHRLVGEWQGPDNEHVRDAIKLLVAYGFIN